MFNKNHDLKPSDSKVWLSSPTMHGEELKYMTEAFETNWMSTVGGKYKRSRAYGIREDWLQTRKRKP